MFVLPNHNQLAMFKYFFVFMLCLKSFHALSQNEDDKFITGSFSDRFSGNMVYFPKYADLKGSAYLYDSWLPGKVILSNGGYYNDVLLKFDLYANKFIFNRHDSSFEIGPDVQQINLYTLQKGRVDTLTFKRGYGISKKIDNTYFLQLLAAGKITFLKEVSKQIESYKEYGNATEFQRFKDVSEYYIYEGNEYKTIHLSKNDLQNIVMDKWSAVEKFIESNKINTRNENGWIAVLNYYNAL